jgi:MSHA biogenesis protein MshG
MHTSEEIEAAASALANQLSAGIPMREAVARMAKLQKKHAELWQAAADSLARGGRLSRQLEGAWPEAATAALHAGEESGTVEAVLRRVVQSVQVKQQVRKVATRLVSPIIAFCAGLGVFIFFMVGVIPQLQASLGGAQESLVFRLSAAMHYAAVNWWPLIALALAGGVAAAVHWLKQPQNQDQLVGFALDKPGIGPALVDLYFGLWAYQMALLAAAGLSAKQQLLLSAKTLPTSLREGVLRMAAEVEKRGHAEAADPDKQPEDDPRRRWPFYVSTAFAISHETGRIDAEMLRCAPILVEEGVKGLTRFITAADLLAKISAATMIALPLLAYFSQLASSLTQAFTA